MWFIISCRKFDIFCFRCYLYLLFWLINILVKFVLQLNKKCTQQFYNCLSLHNCCKVIKKKRFESFFFAKTILCIYKTHKNQNNYKQDTHSLDQYIAYSIEYFYVINIIIVYILLINNLHVHLLFHTDIIYIQCIQYIISINTEIIVV